MLPVGLGIGATQVGWFVMSPTRAAGILPMRTFGMPGPAIVPPWAVLSVILAAGLPMMLLLFSFSEGKVLQLCKGLRSGIVGGTPP